MKPHPSGSLPIGLVSSGHITPEKPAERNHWYEKNNEAELLVFRIVVLST
jgi:hypothetical protein